MKSKTRTKSTGEVFTPPELVDEIIDNVYAVDPQIFLDPNNHILDPACGDGEFLKGVVRKLKQVRKPFTVVDWEYVIQYQLLGVDLMWDNVCDTVYHLLTSYEPINIDLTVETEHSVDITPHSTVEEINNSFKSRIYSHDGKWFAIFRKQKGSNHVVEYKMRAGEWVTVYNIVCANSLTEWDFENWKRKQTIDDLIE